MNDVEQQILNTLRPFPPTPGNPALIADALHGNRFPVGAWDYVTLDANTSHAIAHHLTARGFGKLEAAS